MCLCARSRIRPQAVPERNRRPDGGSIVFNRDRATGVSESPVLPPHKIHFAYETFFDFSVRRFGASYRRLQRQRHRRSRTARGAGARYQTSGGGRSVAPFGFARRRNVVVRIRGRKSGRGRGYRRFDDRCVGAFVRLLRFRPDRLLVRSERGRGTHRQRRVDL